MRRTDRIKLTYGFVLAIALFGAIYWISSSPSFLAFVLVMLAVVIPGRAHAFAFRDLYKGLDLMKSGHYANAIPTFEHFIATINRRPILNNLLWCNWNIYTTSAEALAQNNIGASYIRLSELAYSILALDKALQLDPLYPKPYFNKAVVELINGNEEQANYYLRKAKELGFAGGGMAKARRMAQSVSVNLLDDDVYPVPLSVNERNRVSALVAKIQPLSTDHTSYLTKAHHQSDYVLVALNDDKTPMEYVFVLLVRCFNFDVVAASAAVLQIHESGSTKIVGGDLLTLEMVETRLKEISAENDVTFEFRIDKNE